MKKTAKRWIRTGLARLGLELVRKSPEKSDARIGHSMPDCHGRLRHAKFLGFEPLHIVDAGAFSGDWSCKTHQIFPEACFLVIEPNPMICPRLEEQIAGLSDKVIYEAKAVGADEGMLDFHIWGDPMEATSASLHRHVQGAPDRTISVPVTTLDSLAAQHRLSPDLVKLDLQGAELQALHGAIQILPKAEMFVVEFGCLDAYLDRTTPRQLMDFFYDHGYCLYDIVDCHYRPYDGALTGGDFFFVNNSSPLRSHSDYF